MERDIVGLAEKMFAASVFDPTYMDAEFTRQQFRTALAELSDEEYEHIQKKMEESE